MEVKILMLMQLQQEKLEIWVELTEEDNLLVWEYFTQQDKFLIIQVCAKF